MRNRLILLAAIGGLMATPAFAQPAASPLNSGNTNKPSRANPSHGLTTGGPAATLPKHGLTNAPGASVPVTTGTVAPMTGGTAPAAASPLNSGNATDPSRAVPGRGNTAGGPAH